MEGVSKIQLGSDVGIALAKWFFIFTLRNFIIQVLSWVIKCFLVVL